MQIPGTKVTELKRGGTPMQFSILMGKYNLTLYMQVASRFVLLNLESYSIDYLLLKCSNLKLS